jgi:DNA (cytosine-5)-methyltransferase 1
MTNAEIPEILQKTYDTALKQTPKNESIFQSLEPIVKKNIEYLVSRSESNKAVLAVIVTLLTCKITDPAQDIRNHYARMDNGFSARGIDTNYITPFMKKVRFPAMSESGWKTNTLAVNLPYDLEYPGVIKPKEVKTAFLELVDQIQNQKGNPYNILLYMFSLLINQRDNSRVELAKPHNLSIASTVALLEKHFTADYTSFAGASRLPTLAIYAAYQCMMNQVARYDGKVLCPLENHNSADLRSGRIGDIDVNNADGTVFEGVEIKHKILVTPGHIGDAYHKFKSHKTDRYYILTTANMTNADWESINKEIQTISQIDGCEVIVNGVYTTLKYYLRLLADKTEFIDRYVECMKADDTIKYQHKTMWNEVVMLNN